LQAAALEVCTNALLAVILLPDYGIVGVAWATLLAFFTEKIYLICHLYFVQRIAPAAYIAIQPLLGWGLLLFFAYFWV
jgi:Na+-driven multidrug efflux pump